MSVMSEDMEFPANLQPGQALKDARVKLSVRESLTKLSYSICISKRKVEAIEDITSPAGTFSCYKITSDIELKKEGKNLSAKSAEWYAKNVGIVRSESYNPNGKLTQYTLLTDFKD